MGTLPLRAAPADVGLSLGFGGLMTCGSWHSCVTCGAKIAVKRAEELEHLFRVWRGMGGGVVLATLSCRHNRGQSLEELVRGQRAGWEAVRSDRAWKEDLTGLGVAHLDAHAAERAELELLLAGAGPDEAKNIKRELKKLRKTWGVIRAFEVMAGDEHGWHPHFHVFMLVERPISVETARARLTPMWRRWEKGLATHGLTAVASVNGESAGFDVQVLETGEASTWAKYPFKLALEAVGGVFKHGRETPGQRHRTPFEVMADYAVAVAEGDTMCARADRQIINEWSTTANDMRFRQCPWPPGMREYFARKAAELNIPGPLLDEEQTDEEIAAADTPEAQTVGHVSAGVYRRVIAFEMDTLRAAGRRGFAEVVRWFDQRRIPLDLTDTGETWLLENTGGPPTALVAAGRGS